MTDKDRLYNKPMNAVGDFAFDERVAHVFTDMINRSVPGYAMLLEMLSVIAHRYAQPDSTCYDLGCSLGASTLAIRCTLDERTLNNGDKFNIVAVDSSAAMMDRCRVNLARVPGPTPAELYCQRLQDTPVTNASLVILNFTLQFIPVAERFDTLTRIARGTLPGGVLVLSEKISHMQPQTHELMTELHHAFKRVRGYSELEIAQKRAALENVLRPETIAAHRERLLAAGFRQVELWFQCFNFVSLLAIK